MAAGSGQFVDLLAMKTLGLRGPSNVDRFAADDTGALWVSKKGAPYIPLQPVSGDEYDMFKARAQSVMPPGFGTAIQDEFYGTLNLFVGIGAGSTPSHLTSGRSGGGKKTISLAAGAANFEYESFSNAISNSTVPLCASMATDPWYVGSSLYVVSAAGASEVGFCGWYNFVGGTFAATDGASPQYVSFGIDLPTSATNLVCRSYQGGGILSTKITAIPIEFGVLRRWEMSNDGNGTISFIRDGVVMDQQKDLLFMTTMYNGTVDFLRYMRSNTTGAPSIVYDWFAAAFSRS